MGLLFTFIVCVVIGQTISVTVGLIIEQFTSSYTSMLAFVPLYFSMFWIAWKVAVRITEPKVPAVADQSSATVSQPAVQGPPQRREAPASLRSQDAHA